MRNVGAKDTPVEPWATTKETILSELSVSVEEGLSSEEARDRLKRYGPNLLRIEKKTSRLKRLAAQFRSPVVIVLLVATLVSALIGETTDAIAIAAIILINAVIGYMQESKAEAAVEALKQLARPKCRIVRDGAISEIAGSEVCPGDILVLESGDYIAADARIIVSNQLTADEAVLTGESLPVEKSSEPVAREVLLSDRCNMLFAGTSVSSGTARAVVTATGMVTEIGSVARMLGSAETPRTPLQIRLEQVSRRLLALCAVVVVLVAVLGAIHGEKGIDVLMMAISLAVAAIPEGLPTVVTLALALAIRRMVRRNAIVRHLPAVETLGSTDVICTDKTGTLTTGKMRVREVVLPDGVVYDVTLPLGGSNAFRRLAESGVLCSNASLNQDNGNQENAIAQSTGDSTEVALLYLADDQRIDRKETWKRYPRLAEWPFDSVRKRMSVAVRDGSQVTIHVKGAPEAILDLCQLSAAEKDSIEIKVRELSGLGRRLLAVAEGTVPVQADVLDVKQFASPSDVERALTFLGLIAIADPPRPESIKAISDCKAAGIQVVMITGDHPVTARAIARELGIIGERFEEVLSGADLQKMSAQELKDRVRSVAVYARVSPEDKLKIVRAWKETGSVVAMTGDGVNDAPALKEASIGVSMGKGGTEVARQASSMILADDNFATIVSAIEEGRAIFANIRRTIAYLLSGNLAEILIMLGAAIAGWPAPLAPIHLLWINLVTDGLPSLALAAEPVPKNVLKQSGRPSPATFFNRAFYHEMVFIGLMTTLLALGIYGFSLRYEDELTARTHVFSFLVFAELFRSFASRSEHETYIEMGPWSNVYHLVAVAIPIAFQLVLHHTPLFQELFKVRMISWSECLVLGSLTLVPVTAIEIRKILRRRGGIGG